MTQPLDREGIFRALTRDPSVVKAESGAVAVHIGFDLTDILESSAWMPWSEYEMTTEGDFWVITKDGKVNENAVEQLKALGWNGKWASIPDLGGKPCQISAKADTYKNKTRYRAAFINEYDYSPGSKKSASSSDLTDLDNKYGSQLRAVIGTTTPPPKPPGKPSAPPARPAPPAPRSTPPAPASGGGTATATKATTKESAWAEVYDAWKDKNDDAARDAKWEKAMAKVLAGRPESALSAKDWSDIAEDACIPF